MSTFYKLKIQEVQRLTPEAVMLSFAVPADLHTAYQYNAGQYVTLKCTLDGQEVRRAYSLCSAPDSGLWQVGIKAVKGGSFSVFANQQLQAGQLLEVGVPEGRFTFEPKADKQRHLMAIAAGSGITPILSIVKSLLQHEPQSAITLVYGNKNAEGAMFLSELNALSQQYVGRFYLKLAYSQAQVSGAHHGRIDSALINALCFETAGAPHYDAFYLCGPEAMIQNVSAGLTAHNVPEKKIHFELFSTGGTTEAPAEVQGHSQAVFTVDGVTTHIEMSQKQTLLEAALKHGIDAPYSCQGGICSSCLARVTEGQAVMKKNAILTDSEVAEGLVLTCQAHPTTAQIAVDYDDV